MDQKYFKFVHGINDVEKPLLPDGYEMAFADAREYLGHIAELNAYIAEEYSKKTTGLHEKLNTS